MQQVLLWWLYAEKNYVTLRYGEGEKNVLVDSFLRLPTMRKPSVGDKDLLIIEQKKRYTSGFSEFECPEINRCHK